MSGRKFRELISSSTLVRLVGVHNTLSARLVERMGFEAAWVSSLEVSASYGVPDESIITMSEFISIAWNVADAVGIPVIVDADQGYGGSRNLVVATKRFDRAGAAGMSVEDKTFPKRNSLFGDNHELVSVSEFCDKIKSSKDAQRNQDFFFIARTEALIAGLGLDEALDRAHAYADAGADAVLVHSRAASADEVLEFSERFDSELPVFVIPTTYRITADQLGRHKNIRAVIFANVVMRGMIHGALNGLAQLSERREAADLADLQGIVSMRDVFSLMDCR